MKQAHNIFYVCCVLKSTTNIHTQNYHIDAVNHILQLYATGIYVVSYAICIHRIHSTTLSSHNHLNEHTIVFNANNCAAAIFKQIPYENTIIMMYRLFFFYISIKYPKVNFTNATPPLPSESDRKLLSINIIKAGSVYAEANYIFAILKIAFQFNVCTLELELESATLLFSMDLFVSCIMVFYSGYRSFFLKCHVYLCSLLTITFFCISLCYTKQ